MRILDQKALDYKRGVIRTMKPFFEKGMISPAEVEYIAGCATVKAALQGVFQ